MQLFSKFLISVVLVGVVFLSPAIVVAQEDIPRFTRTLGLGIKNDEVVKLQEFLAQFPEVYPEGFVTGYFGPLTESAIQRFQTQNGIIASGTPATTGFGQIGPRTRAKINNLTRGVVRLSDDATSVQAIVLNILRQGVRNDEVVKLQEFLAQFSEIYPEGLVTGYFGPLTESAVQRFQKQQGIVSSGNVETTGYGQVGPKTFARLNELITEGAGASGKIPQGLFRAPGLVGRLDITTSTGTTTPPIGGGGGDNTGTGTTTPTGDGDTTTTTPPSNGGSDDLGVVTPLVNRDVPVISLIGEIRGLNHPAGIAVHPISGNIYIADYHNDNVKVFNSNLTLIQTLGSTRGSAEGQFSEPWDIAFDGFGNVFISDTNNRRVQMFDSSGNFKFSFPVGEAHQGLAIHKDGNLYASGREVKVFDTQGVLIRTQSLGVNYYPRNIALDNNGRVYFSNFGNQSLPPPYTEYVYDNNSSITIQTSQGTLIKKVPLSYQPNFVDVDDLFRIWVADHTNGKIQVYDSEGVHITEFELPFSSAPIGASVPLNSYNPVGLEINGNKLYASVMYDNVVKIYDISVATTTGGGDETTRIPIHPFPAATSTDGWTNIQVTDFDDQIPGAWTINSPKIVWDGDGYGVVWVGDLLGFSGNLNVFFAQLDTAGNLTKEVLQLTNHEPINDVCCVAVSWESLVWTGESYAISWDDYRSSKRLTAIINPDGTLNALGENIEHASISKDFTGSVDRSGSSIVFKDTDITGEIVNVIPLPEYVGFSPDIEWNAKGYAVVWRYRTTDFEGAAQLYFAKKTFIEPLIESTGALTSDSGTVTTTTPTDTTTTDTADTTVDNITTDTSTETVTTDTTTDKSSGKSGESQENKKEKKK